LTWLDSDSDEDEDKKVGGAEGGEPTAGTSRDTAAEAAPREEGAVGGASAD